MNLDTCKRVCRGVVDPSIGPETIALIATRLCNLDCLYCRGGRHGQPGYEITDISEEMTTEQLFSLFRDAVELGVKEINIGGMDGEPFCRKDILSVLRRIKENGLIGSMTTNGSFLDTNAAEVMTEIGWDIMNLSFDSRDPLILHEIRPARNRQPYVFRIIEFLETLERLDSGLRVQLNAVITKKNFRGFSELVRFARNYRTIESINPLKLLNTGLSGNYDALQLDNVELEEFRKILATLKGEPKLMYTGNWQPDPSTTGTSEQRPSGQKCFTNYYILSVNSNGDIIKCPQCDENIAGLNVKTKGLKSLWMNEHLQFRQRMALRAECFPCCCTILKEQNKAIAAFVERS